MKKTYKYRLPKNMEVKDTNVRVENGEFIIEVEFKDKFEPKDGDFVYVRAYHDYIAIFKKEIGEGMYVYANWNMSFSVSKLIIGESIPLCCIQDIREIRPATEEEKKLLINKLAEKGKRWNPETKRIEDVRWRADFEGTYYYIDLDCFNKVRSSYDAQNWIDNIRYHYGNYFKTREAAEKVAEQIREIFKKSKAE